MADVEGRLIEQTRMRRGIARRMSESKQQAPHFYVQTEIAMDALLATLQDVNQGSRSRITVTAALARGCIETLRVHPSFNSLWTTDGLLQADDINLGVAIAIDGGLLAPAVLNAGTLELPELAVALRDLAERARTQALRPREIAEATFTLSNLGMFEVTAFTAILTPPQVATLAAGRPVQRVVMMNNVPTPSSVMTVTLSADHRAVDGADAARWLGTFKALIENPPGLLPQAEQIKETSL